MIDQCFRPEPGDEPILFVYRDGLGEEPGPDRLGAVAAERAARPRKVPTVLSAPFCRWSATLTSP